MPKHSVGSMEVQTKLQSTLRSLYLHNKMVCLRLACDQVHLKTSSLKAKNMHGSS
jgi:hypothetical protein